MARRSPWMQRVAQRPVCRQQAGNPRHEVARSLQAFLDQRNRSQSPALAARHGDERNPVAMAKPMLPPADLPLVLDDRTIIAYVLAHDDADRRRGTTVFRLLSSWRGPAPSDTARTRSRTRSRRATG